MVTYPRALPCGDSAVSIEFGDTINEHINGRVLALDSVITQTKPLEVVETVPTYRALLVHYDPLLVTYGELSEQIMAFASNSMAPPLRERRLLIPVCYSGDFATDLQHVAQTLEIGPDELIARHLAAEYRVYMLGFQPGFAYLGGLDPMLTLPRNPKPRFGAPAGTISIASGQCAVHSVEGPSGWHWIGRTPAITFTDGSTPKFLFEPGDRIRFFPVGEIEWHQLQRAAQSGATIIHEVC